MKKNKPIIALCIILAVVIPVAILAACLAGGGGDETSSGSSPPVSFLSMPPNASGQESAAAQTEEPPYSLAQQPSEPEVSSVLQKQPPPEFVEAPAVSVSGTGVTVTFKTDVNATVNTILATSGDAPSTAGFYDYFNRGQANASAVSKAALYNVNSAGKSQSYTLPDLGRSYYLWINAVENATDTWQNKVTVVQLFVPSATAPLFATTPYMKENTTDYYVLQVEMLMPSTVYALVTGPNDPTPSDVTVRDGSGYNGTVYVRANTTTPGEAPYHTTLSIPKAGLAKGSYKIWFVAASTAYPNAPMSAVTYTTMTI